MALDLGLSCWVQLSDWGVMSFKWKLSEQLDLVRASGQGLASWCSILAIEVNRP